MPKNSLAQRCITALVLLLLSAAFLAGQVSANSNWEKVSPAIAVYEHPLSTTPFLQSSILFVRIYTEQAHATVLVSDPSGASVRSAKSFCQESKNHICINANFFDENRKPLGLVIQNGSQLSALHKGGQTLTGILTISRSSLAIEHRDDFNRANVTHAVQAGPRLLSNGLALSVRGKLQTRRAGVCTNDKNEVTLFISKGRLSQLSLAELQRVLLKKPIECKEALNFDGGGSSQLFVSPTLPGTTSAFKGLDIPGAEEVPAALAFRIIPPKAR